MFTVRPINKAKRWQFLRRYRQNKMIKKVQDFINRTYKEKKEEIDKQAVHNLMYGVSKK